jgi:molybdate transport system substrate-binding protein
MMNRKVRHIGISLLLLFFVTVSGCGSEKAQQTPKELIVYCGITMVKPISEIARIVEKEKGCTIKVIKDGSGTLLKMIENSKQGDLYLPGADSYIKQAESKGLIGDKAWVGYNKAALIVAKGNPLRIGNDPAQVTDKKFKVVLANPELGSIGREAELVLKRRGITYEQLKNVVYFTSDSKDTMKSIIDKEADLTINWYATSLWPENADKVDAIVMDEKYAPKDKLVLAVLKVSQQQEIAKYFLDYAKSAAGQKIFTTHGFLNAGDHE